LHLTSSDAVVAKIDTTILALRRFFKVPLDRPDHRPAPAEDP
jgi:hypothetical protein